MRKLLYHALILFSTLRKKYTTPMWRRSLILKGEHLICSMKKQVLSFLLGGTTVWLSLKTPVCDWINFRNFWICHFIAIENSGFFLLSVAVSSSKFCNVFYPQLLKMICLFDCQYRFPNICLFLLLWRPAIFFDSGGARWYFPWTP